jgi:hypothetical protein
MCFLGQRDKNLSVFARGVAEIERIGGVLRSGGNADEALTRVMSKQPRTSWHGAVR